MQVLISGGLGFIGSRIARSHSERGDSVRVLDNLLPQVHKNDDAADQARALGIEVIPGDVRSGSDWERALAGVEAVYHMAAETGTAQSMNDVARYCETNVTGTALLCEALERFPSVRSVFLPSSRAIYGEGAYRCAEHGIVYPQRRTLENMRARDFTLKCPHCGVVAAPIATPESARTHPASVYATTKLTQEFLLQQACERLDVRLRTARYQNVYGPGQSLNNPYTGVLAIFSRQISENAELDLYEDGHIVRDFVYIDDVVAATIALLQKPEDPGPLNFGSGVGTDLFGIVAAFETAFGRPVGHEVSGRYRFGDIRAACADTTRADAVLGPIARIDLAHGLRALVDWAQGALAT